MKVSFDVDSKQGDVYRVTLSSGCDAFFVQEDISEIVGNNVEIVEIDLERVNGKGITNTNILSKIAEGIARYFESNKKAVLYYYCDDLNDVPMSQRKEDMWPQEYRSRLFSVMYNRYIAINNIQDMMDVIFKIDQDDRPLFMHLIARQCHARYVELLKAYIIEHYGK